MKRCWIDILFFLGLLLPVTGCIKENFDNCPDESSYILYFRYNGDGTTDIFNSKIETVQLYVFDMEGQAVDRFSIPKTSLNELQGIRPALNPGEYEVVCWGNVTALSEITGNDAARVDHYLYSRPYLSDDPILNVDSLYYGRQFITVPVAGEDADTVYFRSAYIKMEVNIEGLSETEAIGRVVGDPQGWLVVNNVYVGYNFLMQQTNEQEAMYPAWVEQSENRLVSRFNLFRFDDENDIRIAVYNGVGRLVYTLSLEEFMEQNGLTVEGINEAFISITLRFTRTLEGVNVHVSVTGWDSGIVEPII